MCVQLEGLPFSHPSQQPYLFSFSSTHLILSAGIFTNLPTDPFGFSFPVALCSSWKSHTLPPQLSISSPSSFLFLKTSCEEVILLMLSVSSSVQLQCHFIAMWDPAGARRLRDSYGASLLGEAERGLPVLKRSCRGMWGSGFGALPQQQHQSGSRGQRQLSPGVMPHQKGLNALRTAYSKRYAWSLGLLWN